MLKWIVIGIVIWYFYKRLSKKMTLQKGNDRDDFPNYHKKEKQSYSDHDDDFIDYEEVD
ncbi:hypothetical protein [Membranihabitans maritimus]|uniref:hypothetical protein n=1 Tax=Membranihabitans maritimus TaxID=2904244 RepID=UPI001F1F4A0D|nr:hypothetical protein [Membranihabitans maritimus]